MPDTNQLSARKKTAPTTPISMTSPTPLKTVTTSKTPAEKNMDDGSDIELEIAKHQAEVKKRHYNLLLGYLWNTANIVIVCLLVFWGIKSGTDSGFQFVAVVLGIGLFFSFFMSIGLVIGWHLEIVENNTEIDVLNAKRRVAKQLTEDAKTQVKQTDSTKAPRQTPVAYFDSLVKLNVENLEAYYKLVRHHTDKSFMMSIVVGIIGLSLIVAGLVIGFLTPAKTPTLSYIASASGIITDFIAGVFFYLYNRTVRQMKEYHDSLLSVQNVLLAFKIIGETQNETHKMDMVSRLLTYMMEKQEISATFSNVSLNGTKERE